MGQANWKLQRKTWFKELLRPAVVLCCHWQPVSRLPEWKSLWVHFCEFIEGLGGLRKHPHRCVVPLKRNRRGARTQKGWLWVEDRLMTYDSVWIPCSQTCQETFLRALFTQMGTMASLIKLINSKLSSPFLTRKPVHIYQITVHDF